MKHKLREELINRRLGLLGHDYLEMSGLICQNLVNILTHFDAVGLYYPFKNEVNCLLADYGISVFLPKITDYQAKEMIFCKWNTDANLKPNKYGILEPFGDLEFAYPPVIVVPLVGFSDDLHRIGYGAGYYDRFFASDTHYNPLKIGVAFDFQKVKGVLFGEKDIRLNIVITEKNIYLPAN